MLVRGVELDEVPGLKLAGLEEIWAIRSRDLADMYSNTDLEAAAG